MIKRNTDILGRKQALNLQFLQIADGLLLAFAFWFAHTFRYAGYFFEVFDRPISSFSSFQWMLFVIVPFGPILLEVHGFYAPLSQKSFGKSLGQIVRAGIWLGLLITAGAFFFQFEVASRAVMPLFGLLGTITILLRERISIAHHRSRMHREDVREAIILAGTPSDIQKLRDSFNADEKTEFHIVYEHNIETQAVTSLVEALHNHGVSRVIFSFGRAHLDRLDSAVEACEVEGVEVWIIADFIRTSIARPDFDVFGTRPAIVFRTTPALSWALMVKDAMDRVGSAIGIILGIPLFGLIALGIWLTDRGPILFRQQRAGKNGRPFTMFKFRSMFTNAEMRKAELQQFNQMTGPVFKMENDPRITPIGRFLRRTSLDELPQLMNVFRGEMSLVGPRPLPITEVEKFETTAQRRRLSMKPGLTCLWQISGRNSITSFSEWVRLDLEYIDNWSLWLDIKILVQTLPAVAFGQGAK